MPTVGVLTLNDDVGLTAAQAFAEAAAAAGMAVTARGTDHPLAKD